MATLTACLGSQASSPLVHLQLLPKYTTLGIDFRDCLFGPVAELLAELRFAARHWTGDANCNVGLRRGSTDDRGGRGRSNKASNPVHGRHTPWRE